MDTGRWLRLLPQFLILIPSAAFCYFAMKNQMKFTIRRTAALCLTTLVSFSLVSAWLCEVLHLDANVILLPALVLFFFLYQRTVYADLSRCLAVYMGVCAIQTFPSQFAFSFDAGLHPMSGAANFSMEAAFFQFGLSCLITALLAYPACHWFSKVVDLLDFPNIWHILTALSTVFLIFNVVGVPKYYSTLHAGRIFYIFPLFEACALVILLTIYLLFYRTAMMILEHAALQERTRLLEMQARQYRALQDHMRQTARLRHDFRHSVRLLSSLAEKGDIDSIRTHLAGYETSLAANAAANYCANPALNALFVHYHDMAASAVIDTNWQISLPESLPATGIDMVSLFGNLLENAIDGCQTLPEGKRYFSLTAETRGKDCLHVASANSFDGKVRKEKDDYCSTKHGGQGTGLASITAVVEKYGGSAKFSNSDTEFFVDVILEF